MKANDGSKVKLEYYSERFATKLFKCFPQWKQYFGYRILGDEEDIANYLEVSIPSANPNVLEPLSIVTYPFQDVIVSWVSGSHMHLGPHPVQPDRDYMERAIEFLEAFVSDQVVFGCYIRDGKSIGGFVHHIAAKMPSQRIDNASTLIYSWLGGHDQTL